MKERLKVLIIVFSLLLLLIVAKSFYEQIIMGPTYASQSLESRTKQFPAEEYLRGDILDRNGISLTDSAYRHTIIIFPKLITDPKGVIAKFKDELPEIIIKDTQIMPYYKKDIKIYPEPFIVSVLNNPKALSIINGWNEPGINILPYKTRYGLNSLAVHIIGYMGYQDNGYYPQGMIGVEKRYEEILKGERPEKIIAPITDARNKILEGLGYRLIELGKDEKRKDVLLTIDARIQRIVEDVLDESKIIKGSVVILDISSGQILAAASRPAYNQNNLNDILGLESSQIERVIDYKVYPGSIFKVITAAAALEEGIVTPETKFICTGSSSDFRVQCPREHGEITFTQAMEQSCNVTFVEVGLKLGRNNLEKYIIDKFKFKPNPGKALDSKEAIAHGVIGQVIFKVSPLEIANMMATIARNGYHQDLDNPWENRLLQGVRNSNDEMERVVKLPEYRQIYSSSTAHDLRKMLTTTNQQGSGRRAWVEDYGSAGKTGTPQANGLGEYMAWYTGYAPVENPQYAIAVLIEEIQGLKKSQLQGGYYAGPVFKEILERIFEILP